MANIQHWLDQIRRAVYGREVRSSIADAIEAINKEQSHLDGAFDQLIINAGNSNAEIVDARVKADGTQFNTLGERLNKNDEELLNLSTNIDDVNKEVVEARTDKAGVDHGRLKVRLDNIDEQLEAKTQGIINVAELGAKLDGRDETDILIKAHDLLPLSGGKIVIPSGKLLISSKIEFTKTVIIEGVCVNHIDTSSSSLILTKDAGEIVLKGNCSGVRSLFVDGLAGNVGNGITMLCGRPWVENLTVTNQGGYGLSIGSENSTDNVNSFYLANIRLRSNGQGGLFVGNMLGVAPNANAGCCTKIDASYNKGDGIVLHNAHDNNFLSAHIELNEGKGVKFIKSSSNYFAKPYLENNVGGDWYGDSNSESNFIDHVRNHSDFRHGYDFENENNYYSYNFLTKGMKDWKNRLAVDKLLIGGTGAYGFWEFIQDSANKLLSLKNVGTSQSQRFKLSHDNQASKVIFDTQGLALNGSKEVITDIMYNAGTRNFGIVNANSTKDITITVNGLGNLGFCIVNTGTLPDGITVMAWVSDVDTVTLRLTNNTNTNSVAINQAFQIMIMKKEYLAY